MKNNRIALMVSGLFCLWVALSNLLLYFFGKSLPVFVTNLLSIAYFIFIPLTPVLRPLGLVEGQLITGPTVLGLVFGCLIYTGILFGIVRLIGGIKKSP